MSSDEEIEKSTGNVVGLCHKSEKCSKITYTRDFLLSFSELDVCKMLPSGFDPSLMSELEDGYHGTQDRVRNPGSLPLQSHRRTDYSSSPPTRGDSRVYGRWDNRSSVRSDRDSDSQLGKDSVGDSSRAYGNQSRKPWQSSEHDGLLGSGSFARPPGFSTSLSGSKGRSTDQYQLKKSNEPYQPPRPYKAGPVSRREFTDSLNDETFGSADCASQDQAEEERRRRESFELMRKEQQKLLQEKQKLAANKLKSDHATNVNEVIEENEVGNKKLDELVTQSVTNSGPSKSCTQASVVRPLVPPGFRGTVMEKNPGNKTVVHSHALEAGVPDTEESVSLAKTIVQDGILDNQEERLLGPNVGLKESISHSQQPSILNKLFGSVLSDDFSGSSDLVEKDIKESDPWTQANVVQSSKFAQWFSKDEKKGAENQSRARSSDLFSIIGGGEKGGSQASDFPFPGSVTTDVHSTSAIKLPKESYKSSIDETTPPILTCEDLEQTILSGYSGSSSTYQQSLQGQNVFAPKEPKAEADDQASHHLLSLLQKGPVIKDAVAPITESVFSGEKVENVTQSGKSLTLETLFGSAFMKELQSSEAPVSEINGPSSIDESNIQQSKSDNFRNLFGIYDTQVDSGSSKQQTDVLSKHGGFDERIDIQLPEEGSLIGVGGPVNTHNSVFNPFGNLIHRESQSSNRPIDISDKLAALTTGFKNERPSMHGRDIPFHNVQAQSQMNHARPFFHQLESHPTHASPPMNFITQEGMIQRGGSMVRPPFHYGQAGIEPPHPILQQIQMQRQTPNNFPQQLQEYNRGAPLPPHLRTRPVGQVQDRIPMQGFSFEQQEPNFGGPGMRMQAPEVSGNRPEAFQKLLEMELRANSSNRMHPFGSLGNNSQGFHGPDSDASFRYRL